MTPIFKNRPNEQIVTTDGRKLYHSRSVAVIMVLLGQQDDGYYVAIEKRGTAPGLDKQGLWCLPCGYLDWDESGPEGIARELWEEVGIDVRMIKDSLDGKYLNQPWFVKTDPDENRQNVTLRYGMVSYTLRLPVLNANNDCEPNEVAEAKWIPLKDIGKYEFAFKHNEVIMQFLTKLKNEKLGFDFGIEL
jgi:8-oxo-dGTP pyrophosphatase MutT (NUDIX family)